MIRNGLTMGPVCAPNVPRLHRRNTELTWQESTSSPAGRRCEERIPAIGIMAGVA